MPGMLRDTTEMRLSPDSDSSEPLAMKCSRLG